jgi:hypothetical protein
MANPSSAVMTEARRGDPHADHRERQPKVTGKRQPGDGLGTIRRFGNGYDRNRVNHYLRSKPRRSLRFYTEVLGFIKRRSFLSGPSADGRA